MFHISLMSSATACAANRFRSAVGILEPRSIPIRTSDSPAVRQFHEGIERERQMEMKRKMKMTMKIKMKMKMKMKL